MSMQLGEKLYEALAHWGRKLCKYQPRQWGELAEQERKVYDSAAHQFAAHVQRDLSLTPSAAMAMADPAPMKDKYTTAEIRAIDDKIVKIVDGDDKVAGLNEDEQATLYKFLRARGWTEEKARLKWSRRRAV